MVGIGDVGAGVGAGVAVAVTDGAVVGDGDAAVGVDVHAPSVMTSANGIASRLIASTSRETREWYYQTYARAGAADVSSRLRLTEGAAVALLRTP